MRHQQTIARIAVVEGFGFWTGKDIRLAFWPAEPEYGIRFVRTDLPGSEPIPASVEYRVEKPRQTTLMKGLAQVDMIEHVMAALRSAGIDNCEVRVNGSEMPGLDGSSAPFFNAIKQAGILKQSKIMPKRVVTQPIRLEYNEGYIDVTPNEKGEATFGYRLAFDDPSHPIGSQEFEVSLTNDTFEKEVMAARTFLLLSEAEHLRASGLCQRVQTTDVLVFGPKGPLDHSLRFANECARHKVLDMIGDFALCSWLWVGNFRAFKTGHRHNADAVQKLTTLTELILNDE